VCASLCAITARREYDARVQQLGKETDATRAADLAFRTDLASTQRGSEARQRATNAARAYKPGSAEQTTMTAKLVALGQGTLL
jgi:hypothetical protein